MEWIDLRILARTGGGLLEWAGTIQFAARYRTGGTVGTHDENSRFLREDGQWFYLGTV